MEVSLRSFDSSLVSCGRKFLALALAALLIFLPVSSSFAKPQIDGDAKRLSSLLAPAAPAKSPQKDVGKVAERMISILEILERSSRSSGPSPDSLLSKALECRSDVGRWEAMIVTHSILTSWREAKAMGLFEDSGDFSRRIRKGRASGGEAVFEHVVPAETYPPASNQLANLRLVPVEKMRASETPLTTREAAFQDQLVKMIEERTEQAARRAYIKNTPKLPNQGPTNAMGETKADQERLWKEAAEKAGAEAVAQMPTIRVRGKMEATPSRKTGNRWRVRVYVENLSSHPTEVEAQVWLVGTTYKKRDSYLMSETTHTLRLRPGEGRMLDLYTKSESSYKGKADDHDELSKEESARSKVRYRGYAITVQHEQGLAAFTGSDQRMTGYVDPSLEPSPLHSMPRY